MTTIQETQLVKMSDRDHRILQAMISNLQSFLKDAHSKESELPGAAEYKVLFHVEQINLEAKDEKVL